MFTKNTLYTELITLRSRLAAEADCMPYMVANNKTLLELAKQRPMDKEQLVTVEGFGQVKVDKFGDAFIAKIKETMSQQLEESVLKHTLESRSKDPSEEQPKIILPSESSPKLTSVVTTKKQVTYKIDEESFSQVKKEDDLWGDDIDDSYLAEIEIEEPKVFETVYVKMEDESTLRVKEDWDSFEEGWDDTELEKSVAEAEKKALAIAATKPKVQVTKKPVFYYESDEDAPSPGKNTSRISPPKKERSSGAIQKRNMSPQQTAAERKRSRKRKLEILLG